VSSEMAAVRLARDGTIAIIGVDGEVDLSNAAELRRGIFGFVENDDEAVILDLSDLTFIDSAGLGMVFELSDLLEERRQRLFLVVPPDTQPRRTVDIIGLGSQLPLFDQRNEAFDAARGSSGQPER
jgi:anti-anti-sigma factor